LARIVNRLASPSKTRPGYPVQAEAVQKPMAATREEAHDDGH
jgi:hypothetical protein